MAVAVSNSDGNVVACIDGPLKKAVQQVAWNLMLPKLKRFLESELPKVEKMLIDAGAPPILD